MEKKRMIWCRECEKQTPHILVAKDKFLWVTMNKSWQCERCGNIQKTVN